MNKTYYVCKYTPIELLEAFGGECQNLNEMPQGFDHADQIAHPNICGFGKALLEAVMSGKVKELCWSTVVIRSGVCMIFWKTAGNWISYI